MIQNQNTSGFSIILAMGLVLVLSFTGLYLLEYMVPFSRNIKGVENASQAFYESYSGIEESLLLIHSGSVGMDYASNVSGTQLFNYSVTSSGSIIPIFGEGNSEYDSSWNQISQDKPISLLIGNNSFGGGANRIELDVRVPDFNIDTSADALKTGTYTNIVFWQLSSESKSLSVKDIIDISPATKSVSLDLFDASQLGLELGDSITDPGTLLSTFYANNCIFSECVLKVSLVNPIISPSNAIYPYLEYKIESSDSIPLSHSYISSTGKSFGFTKQLEVSVPQQSTSSAFDFTVLQ